MKMRIAKYKTANSPLIPLTDQELIDSEYLAQLQCTLDENTPLAFGVQVRMKDTEYSEHLGKIGLVTEITDEYIRISFSDGTEVNYPNVAWGQALDSDWLLWIPQTFEHYNTMFEPV